ncbi:MAG: DUF2125 domain-containing protein [Alphaproteobacteria bacterium]|nr:DUF2125 domain-containing protein [Alphaproteobacteria bacterium]
MLKRLYLYLPVLALAFVSAAYAVWWDVTAGAIEEGIIAWAANPAPGEPVIAYQRLTVTGFPFRIEIVADQPRILARNGTFQAERLIANVQPYDLSNIIFRAGGRQQVTLVGEMQGAPLNAALEGTTRASLMSVKLGEAGPERIDIDLHGFDGTLTRTGEPPAALKADRMQLHGRRVPDEAGNAGPLQFVAMADRLTLGAGIDPLLGPDIAHFSLFARIDKPPQGALGDTAQLQRWLEEGGVLAIEDANLLWGKFDLNAKGELRLDDARRPQGRIDAAMKGYGALIDALMRRGLLAQEDGENARLALNLMAMAAADDKGRVPVPLTLEEGKVFVGRMAVGSLAPLP